jgi:hypothetical protein
MRRPMMLSLTAKAALQRKEPVGVNRRTHGICHEADVRFSQQRWPERQLCEVQLTLGCDRAVSLLRRLLTAARNGGTDPKPKYDARDGDRCLREWGHPQSRVERENSGGSSQPSGREICIRSFADRNARVGFLPAPISKGGCCGLGRKGTVGSVAPAAPCVAVLRPRRAYSSVPSSSSSRLAASRHLGTHRFEFS